MSNLRLLLICALIVAVAGCDEKAGVRPKAQHLESASVPAEDSIDRTTVDTSSRDAAGEVEKFDNAGKITRLFAETAALDHVAKGERGNRERLTASAIRHDKYWHTPESGGDAVLISGWSVTVWRKPEKPGSFVTLFVADDGSVKDIRGGN